MRSYCAIYVDAGYLLASSATRVSGTSLRRGVAVDHAALIGGLIEQVEADSGLPLLRVNWYDSGGRPGGMPDVHQDNIGLLPRVKLRLGRLSQSGEQKGVDLRMGLDLATYARNRVVDVIYLVSGDDDLTEAVEEAQFHGLQVVILAVPDQRGRPHAVAKNLQREADGVILIDAAVVDSAVKSLALDPALVPGLGDASEGAGVGDVAVGDPAGAAGAADGAPRHAAGDPAPGHAGGDSALGHAAGDPGVGHAGGDAASGDAPGDQRGSAPTGEGSAQPAATTAPAGGPQEAKGRPADRHTDRHTGGDVRAEGDRGVDPGRSSAHEAGAHEAGALRGHSAGGHSAGGQSGDGHSGKRVASPEAGGAHSDLDASEGPGEGRTSTPKPSVLAGRRPTAIASPKPTGAAKHGGSTPMWSSMTGGSGRGEDDGITSELIDAVVHQILLSWTALATPEMLIELRRGEPFIPGDLDRTLLLDLSSRSGVYDIDDQSRHALRDRFWAQVKRLKMT